MKKNKLTLQEKAIKKNQGKQKRSFVKTYIGKVKGAFSVFISFNIIVCIIDVFKVIMLAKALEQLTLSNYDTTIKYLIITTIIMLIRRLIYFISAKSFNYIATNGSYYIKTDLTKKVFQFSSTTFSNKSTGKITARVLDYPADVINNLESFVESVIYILYNFSIIFYITFLNIYLGIVLLIGLLLATTVEIIGLKIFGKDLKRVMNATEKVKSLTTEVVRSEKDIKSLALEKDLYNEIDRVSKIRCEHAKRMSNNDCNKYSLRNLIIEMTTFIILIMGVYLLRLDLITMAVYLIIYSNSETLYSFVWTLGNMGKSWKDMDVCIGKIVEFYDDSNYEVEEFGDINIPNVKGDVEFKNVGYTYCEYDEIENDDTGLSNKILKSKNQIFKNLSFQIKANTTVAFAGKSGSGKTTILNLVAKMIESESGQITIDGVDIKSLNRDTLRNNVALVNQFPYIFDMTIKENLLLVNKSATDEQIDDCIKRAALEEFVAELPNGLDTKVGESGVKLSGGQKQRLAIARALLKNNKILVFDESTSSLDNIAQAKIKESIDKLKGTCTVIMVAHRLSTIRDVDVIYFLDNGEIVDFGNFETLFNKNADFRNMFMVENLTKKLEK